MYPEIEISYYFLRKFIKKDMNISFANLVNEEYEMCSSVNIHLSEIRHQEEEGCGQCKNYNIYKAKYIENREEYQKDLMIRQKDDCIYYSVDLQKVMLPRLEMYKEMFYPRIICFNESFVPLGKTKHYPFAVL